MPIVVNSNVTATTASFNLSHANNALRKSLARLSSGNRIVNPADDAGGMAVAYKLDSTLKAYGSSKAEYPEWYLLSSGSGWCS